MANELQNITNENSSQGKRYLVDDLAQDHQEAVYLRLEGAEYVYIAKRLKWSYTYVRKLFAVGGACKPAYDELREELSAENRERFVKLRETMQEAAPEAFTSLRLSAKKSWKAAESLLHMAGFTPEQKIITGGCGSGYSNATRMGS